MKAQIDLNSISMSKNDPKLTQLEKYDVDANIDEVQSDDEVSVFTYKFTALSNPKPDKEFCIFCESKVIIKFVL